MKEKVPTILVVEDDVAISKAVADRLSFEGWKVVVASDGKAAIKSAEEFEPDAVVLDLMLPKIDGFEVIEEVRKFSQVPIVVLTARDTEEDEIRVLELGADDFMVKPLRPSALIARMKIWLKRYEHINEMMAEREQEGLQFEGVTLFPDSVYLQIEGRDDLKLTKTEHAILLLLMTHPERVYSRDQIMKKVWNWESSAGTTRTIDAHVKSLRHKMREGAGTEFVKTVHGVGYTLSGHKAS